MCLRRCLPNSNGLVFRSRCDQRTRWTKRDGMNRSLKMRKNERPFCDLMSGETKRSEFWFEVPNHHISIDASGNKLTQIGVKCNGRHGCGMSTKRTYQHRILALPHFDDSNKRKPTSINPTSVIVNAKTFKDVK